MKLAFIIDKSSSYISFQQDKVFSDWGIDPGNVENFDKLSEVGEQTLFGDTPHAVIVANDLTALKALTESFESFVKTNDVNTVVGKFEHGLVITTTVPRVSTKKLEKVIENLGGTVILAKENAKENPIIKILAKTNLSREVKNFIQDYSGDQYDSMLSVIRTVSELPTVAQSRISIDDIMLRTPQSPGSIAPWEIEKSFMSGNIQEMISTYRRITAHTHALPVVSILKNKITAAYRIASVIENTETRDLAEITTALGIKNDYPAKLALGIATKMGVDRLEEALEEFTKLESNLKGNSSANSNEITEIALVRITRILNS